VREKYEKSLYVAPCIVYLLAMVIFPLLFSLYLVFHSWIPARGPEIIFVGLGNFYKAFDDPRFINAIQVTVSFVVIAVTIEFFLGLGLALFLTGELKGQRFMRICITLPMLLTPVAISYNWRTIFDRLHGPLNYVLGLFGIQPMSWLSEPSTALWTIVIADVWQWTPFMFLTLIAAIEALPVEVIEAGSIDGVSGWQSLRYLKLPLMMPMILTVLLLRSIEAFKIFDLAYVLTGGGPGTSTEVASLYTYVVTFTSFNLGYASTLAYILLIIVTALMLAFIRVYSRLMFRM